MTGAAPERMSTLRLAAYGLGNGGFQITDADGNMLFTTGLTIDEGPGKVYIPAGGTVPQSPYGLNKKEALMKTLSEAPESLTFSFSARGLTYADGTIEERLESN